MLRFVLLLLYLTASWDQSDIGGGLDPDVQPRSASDIGGGLDPNG